MVILRKRSFYPVEGEGEQSFIKWLQILADQNQLYVHLDCKVLGGGGYKTMLEGARFYIERKNRKKSENCTLLIDVDRSERDDGWSLAKLTTEAKKYNINVCMQKPSLEGLLLRLFSGKENLQPSSSSDAKKELCKLWPDYEKSFNADALKRKFTLIDLLRAAKFDPELHRLLSIIGFVDMK